MSKYYGDFSENKTIYIPFNTCDATGASVTVTGFTATDVHIHKDGNTTQRNNASGISVLIDYDGITGNHLLVIDTSDNAVAGFYATGSDYQVRVEGVTVATKTINAFLGSFSIENRFMRGTDSAATAANLAVVDSVVNAILADTETTIPATLATLTGKVDTIDGVVDDILTDTGTTIPGTIATLASDLSVVDGIVDNIYTAYELDGSVYRLTTNALELAPTGSGASAATIATEVWSKVITSITTTGSAAKIVQDTLTDTGTTLPAILTTIDSIVDAILVDTNELQVNQGNWATATGFATASALTTINSVVDTILADTDELQVNQGGWATLANQTIAKNIREADVKLVTSTTPYTLVYYLKGTSTALMTKQLKEADGTNIIGTGQTIGQQVQL